MELHEIVKKLSGAETENYISTESGFLKDGACVVEFKDSKEIEKDFKLRKPLFSFFSLRRNGKVTTKRLSGQSLKERQDEVG